MVIDLISRCIINRVLMPVKNYDCVPVRRSISHLCIKDLSFVLDFIPLATIHRYINQVIMRLNSFLTVLWSNIKMFVKMCMNGDVKCKWTSLNKTKDNIFHLYWIDENVDWQYNQLILRNSNKNILNEVNLFVPWLIFATTEFILFFLIPIDVI